MNAKPSLEQSASKPDLTAAIARRFVQIGLLILVQAGLLFGASGHLDTVETGGPYRFVRHPGYVSMFVSAVGTIAMLGSVWALIPMGLLAGSVVIRTALEDQTLQNELPGYADYARRVRYRLLPGVW
jgi:protein-S-isoprenylcysteine O-methyltransferase Ste14